MQSLNDLKKSISNTINLSLHTRTNTGNRFWAVNTKQDLDKYRKVAEELGVDIIELSDLTFMFRLPYLNGKTNKQTNLHSCSFFFSLRFNVRYSNFRVGQTEKCLLDILSLNKLTEITSFSSSCLWYQEETGQLRADCPTYTLKEFLEKNPIHCIQLLLLNEIYQLPHSTVLDLNPIPLTPKQLGAAFELYSPKDVMNFLRYSDTMKDTLPELHAAMNVKQDPEYNTDTVGEHLIKTLNQSEVKKITKQLPISLACLFHDIGKPDTASNA